MRKLIPLMLVVCMVCLFACESKKTSDAADTKDTASTTTPAAVEEKADTQQTVKEQPKTNGKYFSTTHSNIVVRKGAGKNFGPVIYYGEGGSGNEAAHMNKGDVVKCLSDVQDGYVKVKGLNTYGWDGGWVAYEFLEEVNVCGTCKGTGLSNLPCTVCGGEGCEGCPFNIPPCKTCKGKGAFKM